ncbi:MAG: glutamine amidotransferase family protein [bacterium]
MSESGHTISGEAIITSIANMHDRSNGLGGGFAAYGIYPEHKDHYAFHLMYDDAESARETEMYLKANFQIHEHGIIPHRHDTLILHHPLLRRYFVTPLPITEATPNRVFENLPDDECVFRAVMEINTRIKGAFVFSSGKNMGIFKGVGYPEVIGEFFRLDNYKAYLWTAHGRFPTNTTGWWGGAHPFGLLDWSVVHNGEVSSYGINKRYLANFGYNCSLQTDTEVITYLFDLLVRKHNLSLEHVCTALAPPFWFEIEKMEKQKQEMVKTLRIVYGGALLNGPFSILVGFGGGMIALNDRIKLRPLVAARRNDTLYVASEESAIRVICPQVDEIWSPEGGRPVIGLLKGNNYEEKTVAG